MWNGLPVTCKRRTCPVCGPKRARLLARVLELDATAELPGHCLTLTTRRAVHDAASFRRGMESVFSRRDGLRSRWPCEYFARIEFTTGAASTSGGARRMHAHLLVKGLAGADLDAEAAWVRSTWKRHTGAWRVELAELQTPAAAIAYLGLHHAKASQLPPPWWRGMAERSSRGYWSKPVRDLREEARRQLWAEGLAWRLGVDVATARRRVDRDCRRRDVERDASRAALEALRFDMPAASTPAPRDVSQLSLAGERDG